MTGSFCKLRLAVQDRLRYSASMQSLLGIAKIGKALCVHALPKRLDLLAEAYRVLAGAGNSRWVESFLRPHLEDPGAAAIWRDQRIGWKRIAPLADRARIKKGLVLKSPVGNNEKGVILLSFEYSWLSLLCARELPELFCRYTFVCSPAWFPTSYQACWSFAHIPEADIFFMLANRADIDLFSRFKTGTHVAPLYGCDWINPTNYEPVERSKREIDIVMVANWAPFKRHWVLFKALRKITRPLRILLIGQPETGRTMEDVMREADYFGVRHRIEFHNQMQIAEVSRNLCNARISMVLSKREGYCNAVAESLAADTPVALVKGTQMGPAAYINSETGVFLDENRFAEQLESFLDRSLEFHPRAWAERNIGCHVSTARLNAQLKQHALSRGQEWTRDICTLGWRPNPRYVNPADELAMAPIYAGLLERHGLTWGEDLSKPY